MKVLFLGVLLLSMSCGKIDGGGVKLAETRSINPVVITSFEKAQLRSICNSLSAKVKNLSESTLLSLSYSVRQKECSADEDELGPATSVAVNIEGGAGSFKLRRTDNTLPFIYPDLETSQSGIMSTICANLDEETTNPLILENGNSLWVKVTQISPANCDPKRNELCIQIETGTPDGASHRIRTREWIKFQVDPLLPKYGFFTQRKTLSSVHCAPNESSQIEATLIE